MTAGVPSQTGSDTYFVTIEDCEKTCTFPAELSGIRPVSILPRWNLGEIRTARIGVARHQDVEKDPHTGLAAYNDAHRNGYRGLMEQLADLCQRIEGT